MGGLTFSPHALESVPVATQNPPRSFIMAQYLATIPVTLRDADMVIGVTDYSYNPGSGCYNAPSDLEYYGYEDCDFRKLENKIAIKEDLGVDF